MSQTNFTEEQIAELSMLDMAYEILKSKGATIEFHELFEKISRLKQFTEEQKADKVVRFFSDLNVDGRFMTSGDNNWGLKRWYPVDTTEEDLAPTKPKKKKKRSSQIDDEEELHDSEEDIDLGDLDDLEDLEEDEAFEAEVEDDNAFDEEDLDEEDFEEENDDDDDEEEEDLR
ncbi:DNA-directed RNA polymerase subunit delta [Bacillaceae bacterium SIJ1]|uniref:DNA-directed RNA polymerase subunit delta n=1 Tax=Litoribacterium kuwaitense TaxID=1398745 RepID=UPI0013EA62A1|nr:DNA-directed RNA polymerase subunit delta [Litoribacterium kuwaitense]NGP44710.1 DNA-directed RNA polymerase subunit delta [Litoribacterium kuwaitense]